MIGAVSSYECELRRFRESRSSPAQASPPDFNTPLPTGQRQPFSISCRTSTSLARLVSPNRDGPAPRNTRRLVGPVGPWSRRNAVPASPACPALGALSGFAGPIPPIRSTSPIAWHDEGSNWEGPKGLLQKKSEAVTVPRVEHTEPLISSSHLLSEGQPHMQLYQGLGSNRSCSDQQFPNLLHAASRQPWVPWRQLVSRRAEVSAGHAGCYPDALSGSRPSRTNTETDDTCILLPACLLACFFSLWHYRISNIMPLCPLSPEASVTSKAEELLSLISLSTPPQPEAPHPACQTAAPSKQYP